ncbi:MAG: DNA replication and repair protein RecF [Candidatus Peregrinibacteria bacterium Gr01-1014_25]|nr:MAG: DNA replication and repair protein RecF [Candidatus Peregrinibacteria bacterium Gr01-1014_25]
MRLSHLVLENFRNHRALALEIGDAPVHLFIGPNGAGKTNLLEAIALLSLTKSCRGAEDDDLVMWEQPYLRVRGTAVADDGGERCVEVVAERTPRRRKATLLADARVPAGNVVGVLPSVAFLPEDLALFRGPPMGRRRFLDQLLCQVDAEYLRSVVVYQRLLRQRGALLKRIAAGDARAEELAVWDQPLAQAGAAIVAARSALLGTFSLTLANELRQLGLPWRDARMVEERQTQAGDAAGIERELLALLVHHRPRDIAHGATSAGPHRDDWNVHVDGRHLATFASRGQERLVLLALLALEVAYLELKRGERPIVLLDDVFSELDERHQQHVLSALGNHQTFLTATHAPPVSSAVHVWDVGEQQEVALRR